MQRLVAVVLVTYTPKVMNYAAPVPNNTLLRALFRVLATVGVMASLCLLFWAPQAHAQPKTGLCFDALAGVATRCPTVAGFPVDGKKGAKFDGTKCYRIDDPEKGWTSVNVNCGDQVFKDVVDTQKVPEITDNARGACDKALDPSGKCDIVALYINPFINGLAIIVLLAVVISIIIGGIQYSASADQPAAAAAAKQRIINAVLALLAFMFLWAFLQWIVPGGLL